MNYCGAFVADMLLQQAMLVAKLSLIVRNNWIGVDCITFQWLKSQDPPPHFRPHGQTQY